jgi:hypothetical protein
MLTHRHESGCTDLANAIRAQYGIQAEVAKTDRLRALEGALV